MPTRRRVTFGDVADLHGVVHESAILGVEHYLLPAPEPTSLIVEADLPDRPLGNLLSCEPPGHRGLRRDHHEVSLVLGPTGTDASHPVALAQEQVHRAIQAHRSFRQMGRELARYLPHPARRDYRPASREHPKGEPEDARRGIERAAQEHSAVER